MFLERLRARNPDLAEAAIRLHQAGELRANTYLIDLDTMARNAAHVRAAAEACGVQVYFMGKQFGRNPDASRAMVEAGLPSAVCVDLQCMEAHVRSGVPVGHVGHLVQTNRGTEDAVVAAEPKVVTVFSIEAATRLGQAARRAGKEQAILLRVQAPGDTFYFGHGGGFLLGDIENTARAVENIGGLRVAGVTSFPCLLANASKQTIEPTHNLGTIVEAANRLRAAGHTITQINAPGTTSAGTLATLAAAGATHVEPGNALHGTTPLHLFDSSAPELPGDRLRQRGQPPRRRRRLRVRSRAITSTASWATISYGHWRAATHRPSNIPCRSIRRRTAQSITTASCARRDRRAWWWAIRSSSVFDRRPSSRGGEPRPSRVSTPGRASTCVRVTTRRPAWPKASADLPDPDDHGIARTTSWPQSFARKRTG